MGNCAVVLGTDLPSHRCSVGKGEAMLHCGCKIPVIPSACVSHDEKCNLPVIWVDMWGNSLLRCYEIVEVAGW